MLKTEEIKLSEDVKWTESRQEVGEEKDVSVHETEISVAEELKLKDVIEEKDTSIKSINLARRQS